MARGQTTTILDPIRRLIGGEGGCVLTDAELLEKFVATADAAAFEVLVWRHGPMVLGLCRRILRDQHEAEDAFQATFLVFARKARSIGRHEAIGCWLYKVAFRIALRLRASAAKRPATGEPTDNLPAPEPADDADWRDLRPVLDEEIARLPEKYRAAFVLCYLEGRTNEEAAIQLGCPKGTILSRLSRGREWLRTRLTRRGVALTTANLTLTVSRNAMSATIPTALAHSTINAALPFAAGKAARELVSTTVAALIDGVLRTMILAKVKIVTIALLVLAVLGTGIVWAACGDHVPVVASDTMAIIPPPTPLAAAIPIAADEKKETPDQQPRDRRDDGPTTGGKVVAIAKDGKSFTIEVPAQTVMVRAAPRQVFIRTTIKITEKTAITYNNVPENGAKLTEGYHAGVQLEKGSNDVALAVRFSKDVDRQKPDIVGEVVGSTKDSITLTHGPRERGGELKKETIPFNNKTLFVFDGVATGEAKITDGYHAQISLADDGKTAHYVEFFGMVREVGQPQDAKRPEITGKVAAVSADGKTLTIESVDGRNVEPKNRQEIIINDKTAMFYNKVGLDGAKPTKGYSIWVWLAEGSKDTAAKIGFTGATPQEPGTVITGKVVEVSGAGKEGITISIEQPAKAKGEEPKRTKVKIPAAVKFTFNGVGPDEAKPTVGYYVTVRLRDGSTDTATKVMFSKAVPAEERKRE